MKTTKTFAIAFTLYIVIAPFLPSIWEGSGMASAQAPNYLWAKSAGGNSDDGASSVSTDVNGNIIVAGYFASDTITFGATTLTNAGGGGDMFISKYDASGNALWAKNAVGSGFDYASSVSTDANDDILVVGSFYGPTITFGPTTLTNTSADTSDMFLAKYDASGNALWAKNAEGSDYDEAWSVSTDATGNILVAGYFGSPTITFGAITLTNAGGGDMFISKYDASGNALWAKNAVGSGFDVAWSVSTDANGNILVAGSFRSATITFGATTLTNDSAGYYDMFLAKLDNSTGINEWSAQESFSLFPNPASGEFQIQLPGGSSSASFGSALDESLTASGRKYSLEIYNVFGEKVTRSVIPSGARNLLVDLSNHPDGVYFIAFKDENEISYFQKFILVK